MSDIVERAEAAFEIRGEEFGGHYQLVSDLFDEVKRLRAHVNLLNDAIQKERESTIHYRVSEFHRVYGQPIEETPRVPSDDVVRLRARLIAEEFVEMMEATFGACHAIDEEIGDVIENSKVDVDLPDYADALADMAYVIEGANLTFGINSTAVLAEVQRANLSKLGSDGKPVRREDGKIVKGPNFSPPDVSKILRAQGWEG